MLRRRMTGYHKQIFFRPKNVVIYLTWVFVFLFPFFPYQFVNFSPTTQRDLLVVKSHFHEPVRRLSSCGRISVLKKEKLSKRQL